MQTSPPPSARPDKAGARSSSTVALPSTSPGQVDNWPVQFPFALPENFSVWGICPGGSPQWVRARIIHCRRKASLGDTPAKDANDYDYYVHWCGRDRRLDCWVAREALKDTQNEIPEGDDVELNTPSEHDSDHDAMDSDYIREHKKNTKVKTIRRMRMGRHVVDCWYFSPFPKDYQDKDCIHFCEFCLVFFRCDAELAHHTKLCSIRHPPGDEIYRKNNVSVFEVDGSGSRVYCENLCFLAKMFLDHKTLRHQVGLFLFYVVTEYDEYGYHIVGYFSKEKYSKNNLSCILTLPQHQRKGYGKFLISFSYALARKELEASIALSDMRKALGGPERPFSDLGRASYMTWWTPRLLNEIKNRLNECRATAGRSPKRSGAAANAVTTATTRIDISEPPAISIRELSNATYISPEDVWDCLSRLGVLREHEGEYIFYLADSFINKLLAQCGGPGLEVDYSKIHWAPYDQFMAQWEFNPHM